MFSQLLRKSDIPETMWLPREIRIRLEGGSGVDDTDQLPRQTVLGQPLDRRYQLQSILDALNERVGHVEDMLNRMEIESRISRLEDQFIAGCMSPQTMSDTSTYIPLTRRGA